MARVKFSTALSRGVANAEAGGMLVSMSAVRECSGYR